MMFRFSALLLLFLGTFAACHTAPQRLQYDQHQSQAMGDFREYGVYLPPGIHDAPDRLEEGLPLVVFLHGSADNPQTLDRYSLGAAFDEAIAAGTLPPFVMIVPKGDMGFWTNWYDGSRRYEDWILDELLPLAQARFQTGSCPEYCHVMGISMGGIGSLRFVLHRPGLFASVTSISGPVFDTKAMVAFGESFWARTLMNIDDIFGPVDDLDRLAQEDVYQQWRDPGDLRGTRIAIAWGDGDRPGLAATNARLADHLTAHGIPHSAEEFAGDHKWLSWSPVIVRSLARALGSDE